MIDSRPIKNCPSVGLEDFVAFVCCMARRLKRLMYAATSPSSRYCGVIYVTSQGRNSKTYGRFTFKNWQVLRPFFVCTTTYSWILRSNTVELLLGRGGGEGDKDSWSMILITHLPSIRGWIIEGFHECNPKWKTGFWLLAGSLVSFFIHHHTEGSDADQTFWLINKKYSFSEGYRGDILRSCSVLKH